MEEMQYNIPEYQNLRELKAQRVAKTYHRLTTQGDICRAGSRNSVFSLAQYYFFI